MATCVKCGKKGVFLKLNHEGLCETCSMYETMDLKRQVSELSNPEYQDLELIKQKIVQQNKLYEETQQKLLSLNADVALKTKEKQQLESQILSIRDELLIESFGLYTPQYDFANSSQYKERLDQIRQKQKDMIKSDRATTGNMGWTVNGNAAQGKKMVKDMQKLLLRAFNSECDELINKVKYNNYEASLKRLSASRDAISKLGQIMQVVITAPYYNLKVEELNLAFEYRQIKQKEKEEQKELRAQMREEARLQKEIEEARKKLEKEQTHYLNALAKLNLQIDEASDAEKADLLLKKQELEAKVNDTEKAIKDVDYREANKRAGYVYVISNIGAFGENVYKIGMTRRLDPMERVDELGDASVPFDFDVHAMIFTEDAPKLESALHQAFEDRKVNMVNHRREFFHVTLDEIKQVVKENFDKTVEFVDVPEAEQYRVTQKLLQES